MATQTQRLNDLAITIGTECKSIRTLLNGKQPDNSALLTTAKGNIVAALNEVYQLATQAALASGAKINDASTLSSVETYSINKIRSEIASTATATRDAILGGAGAAYDTLAELQALLQGEASQITDILSALGNRVRTDVSNQGLSLTQKANARTNIDAYGSVEIGNPDTDLVAVFNTALA